MKDIKIIPILIAWNDFTLQQSNHQIFLKSFTYFYVLYNCYKTPISVGLFNVFTLSLVTEQNNNCHRRVVLKQKHYDLMQE